LQLRALRAAGYHSVSFSEYLASRLGETPLPIRPVLITFDDGYRNTVDAAVPILRRYGFSATFFVVAGLLGGTNAWDSDEIQEPLLTCDDVRRLNELGFEVGSHTLTHAKLPTLSDSRLALELSESKRVLEAVTSNPVTVLAYPWSEHDARVHQAALKAGYRAGAILRRRTNYRTTSLFELRRIGVNDETTTGRLLWDLARLRFRGS
jgi:peptidoglycan/xylan/chitin deacetylase (PgdA/CDA1 family)